MTGNLNHTTAHRRSTQFPLTIYYDAGCRFCNAEMHNLMLRNTAGQLQFVDAAVPGFSGGPAPQAALMRAIHGVDASGQLFTGVECLTRAYQGVGMDWVRDTVNLPGLRQLAHGLYPWVARNRYRIPQWMVAWVFEIAARRAARAAVARSQACQAGRCDLPPQSPTNTGDARNADQQKFR